MSAEPLLEAQELEKHFPIGGGVFRRGRGSVRAVDGVSLEVQRGETLGIVGESGCGKSTTARLLIRLLEPTGGRVLFEGEDITQLRGRQLKALRRQVQMVFQDPYSSLNPRKPVGAIIGAPFEIYGELPDRAARRRRVQELMESVGLNAEHHNRYPHEFSGGQRQRIGIARALALEPKLLVADEPVSALDVSIQAQVLNLLRERRRELSLTLVLIAHDLSVVSHMCDRVAVMYLGKVVEQAHGERLYSRPRHPYTGALLAAVPVADPSARGRASEPPVSGDVPSPAAPPSGCRFHTRCPKVQERCAVEEPPLVDDGEGTLVACHYPLSAQESAATVGGASA